MKKNIFTSESQVVASKGRERTERFSLKNKILSSDLLKNISEVFSMIVEDNVSPLQTLYLLQAMLALVFVVFPIDIPLLMCFLFIGWFALALMQCKQAGLDKE